MDEPKVVGYNIWKKVFYTITPGGDPLWECPLCHNGRHVYGVDKTCSEIVQGDKTGDTPLSETVKQYIKEKYNKPGEVFLGVVHRLDRPVCGLVIFARTSKALTRLNQMFQERTVEGLSGKEERR